MRVELQNLYSRVRVPAPPPAFSIAISKSYLPSASRFQSVSGPVGHRPASSHYPRILWLGSSSASAQSPGVTTVSLYARISYEGLREINL
jgi:hypothetical protein